MLTDSSFSSFSAVAGVLLHADEFSILSIDEIAQRTSLSVSETAVVIMQLDEQGALTIGRLNDQPVYRLNSDGVSYLQSMLAETPLSWR